MKKYNVSVHQENNSERLRRVFEKETYSYQSAYSIESEQREFRKIEFLVTKKHTHDIFLPHQQQNVARKLEEVQLSRIRKDEVSEQRNLLSQISKLDSL